jgi:hypothetical protein
MWRISACDRLKSEAKTDGSLSPNPPHAHRRSVRAFLSDLSVNQPARRARQGPDTEIKSEECK